MGTWNIQGVKQKIGIAVSEMEKLGMDIVTLTETKKKGTGTERVGEYIHIYIAEFRRRSEQKEECPF